MTVKGKGRVRARAHPTQDPEYKLMVRGSQRMRHKNAYVERPLTWLSFEARGVEVIVYLTPDQLRKHIAEAQAALVAAEADPLRCNVDECFHCRSSQTAEQGDS